MYVFLKENGYYLGKLDSINYHTYDGYVVTAINGRGWVYIQDLDKVYFSKKLLTDQL